MSSADWVVDSQLGDLRDLYVVRLLFRFASYAAVATSKWVEAHSFLLRWLHAMEVMFGAAEVRGRIDSECKGPPMHVPYPGLQLRASPSVSPILRNALRSNASTARRSLL